MSPNAAALQEVAKCVAAIKAKLGKDIEITRVVWSNKMTRTWGKASLKAYNGKREYIITLASQIFKTDSPELRSTVAHEVAHLADFQVYNQWGHGRSWRYIMSSVLGYKADRCVTEQEKAALNVVIPKRLITKYEYACGCTKYLVSGAQHNKATRHMSYYSNSGLKCRRCHSYVNFTGIAKKA